MELLEQTIKEIKAIDTMYLDKKEVLKRLALIKKEINKRSGQFYCADYDRRGLEKCCTQCKQCCNYTKGFKQ